MSPESDSNLRLKPDEKSGAKPCVVAFVRNLASREFIRGEVERLSGELIGLNRLKSEESRQQLLYNAVVVIDLADYGSIEEITKLAKESFDSKAKLIIGFYPHIRVDLLEAFGNSSLFNELIPRSKFMRTFRNILLS